MLEARGISAGYGDTIVVRDVSLAAPAGRVVALLGSNGAGKTTLLRVIGGLLRPRRGSVHLDGRDVTGCSAWQMASHGVCYVAEDRGVFPQLTVLENLRLQARDAYYEKAVERATLVFPALRTRLRQRAGSLSGGEQRMLALARVYLTEPRVVVLDEVSMGLAPLVVDEVFEFVRNIAAAGAAIVLVEQYVSRALASADYLYLLNCGRMTFAGEPSEVRDRSLFTYYLGR